MSAATYDVLGIGNAIVDVLARAEDDFLVAQGMRKGAMALIDEPRAEAIYAAMGPAIEISGGSAANTIVGVASLGARAAFVGKVKDDVLGKVFSHDIRAAGVAFATPPAPDGPSTSCSPTKPSCAASTRLPTSTPRSRLCARTQRSAW